MRVGGWINVYQQVRGIATLVDFYLTVRDPTGMSVLPLRVAAPPVSRHLN